MELSRRAFMGAVAAVPLARRPALTVSCTLAESNLALGGQALGLRRGVGPASSVTTDPAGCEPAAGRGLACHVTQIVESAVGYEAEDLSWLGQHGIRVGRPVAVRGPAWIRYSWPTDVLIRDFGRVCPVAGGRVIARLGPMPVAVRRGPFIVLGSPLGPHLYAGDGDARRLFEAFLRSSL